MREPMRGEDIFSWLYETMLEVDTKLDRLIEKVSIKEALVGLQPEMDKLHRHLTVQECVDVGLVTREQVMAMFNPDKMSTHKTISPGLIKNVLSEMREQRPAPPDKMSTQDNEKLKWDDSNKSIQRPGVGCSVADVVRYVDSVIEQINRAEKVIK